MNTKAICELFYTYASERISIRMNCLKLTDKDVAGYVTERKKIQDKYVDYTGNGEDQEANI